jgi:putative NADH-flavin reductase
MTRIAVLGGTGYAGGNVVRAAHARGHKVTAYSETAPERASTGVSYITGSFFEPNFIERVASDADVIVHALAPRGALKDTLGKFAGDVAARAERCGVRLGVVGTAGSLRVSPEGPKFYESPEAPASFRPEAQAMDAILEALRRSPPHLDWFCIVPGAGFGSRRPGGATGSYRIGGEVLLRDDSGESFISGADFGSAVVDEIETGTHRRQRFTVAY